MSFKLFNFFLVLILFKNLFLNIIYVFIIKYVLLKNTLLIIFWGHFFWAPVAVDHYHFECGYNAVKFPFTFLNYAYLCLTIIDV